MAIKLHYAFIGQLHTTAGTANKRTGSYSKYGNIVAFSSRQKRDHFVSDYYNSSNPYYVAVATNYKTAKSKYCAGMTQKDYDDYMLNYVIANVDQEYDNYFNK